MELEPPDPEPPEPEVPEPEPPEAEPPEPEAVAPPEPALMVPPDPVQPSSRGNTAVIMAARRRILIYGVTCEGRLETGPGWLLSEALLDHLGPYQVTNVVSARLSRMKAVGGVAVDPDGPQIDHVALG